MKDVLDVHTHTIASGHAYSTIREMITAAKNAGMKLIGISEHTAGIPGAPNDFYFVNFKVIRRESYDIKVVMGVELNIIDYSGSTDLPGQYLKRVDYAIASLHSPVIDPGSVAENTSAIIGAMRNPHVVIIGHPDRPDFPVDFDAIAKAAKENHVLLEVNNSSFVYDKWRDISLENSKLMLTACQKYGASVIMGSDAHIDFDAGNHELSKKVLRENNFPEELVVNDSIEHFFGFVNYRKSLVPV